MFGAGSSGTAFGQNKPASFSFGSSNNNNSTNSTNSAPGFGASGGSGFSLGGSNANNTSGFGNKPPGTGFGASTTNNPSSGTGGLFGGSNTAAAGGSSTGGLFGSTTGPANNNTGAPGGLFGSSNANNSGNAGTTGNSLFGGNNATSNTTSGFGKPSTPLATSFGAPGASGASQSTTGGGLFGNTSASQPAQSTTGGLFGKPAGTTSGGLFGGSTTQNQPQAASGGGLFGNNNASNTTSGGGLFGNNNTSTEQQCQRIQQQCQHRVFFSPNNAQPSFSWSGSQQQNAGPSGTLSNLEIKIPTAAKTQQNASNYTPAVNDQLTKLKEQWVPNSPKCALKTHLYNKFSEQEISVLLQQPRPANESPEDWEKAMANRPSPLHFPVKVTSFTEMAQRVEVQLDHVAKSRVFLNNIYEKSSQLSSQRDLDTTTRIMKAKARHTKLSRRLLKLATLLAVLKLKGYPLLPEEEEISKEFQVLNAKLSDPNGAVGKLSDLYARLAILKGRSEDLSSQLESSINTMNGGLDNLRNTTSDGASESSTQTEQVIQSLTKLLYKQQIGLGYLNDVVQKDLATVDNHSSKKH
ncbi:hypothetical protein JCM33374_g4787 [Metschnikowia sp. JCM 33374]|nr:hypothetical protein JCM33374_g4787 [Metschnikowia sp. JCM 33374]